MESLYPPVKSSDWEADYVRDDIADHGQWEAQMDYDVARKQRRDMQKQAKNSMKAAVIAEEEFEDMQKQELVLRDKMLQARSLAKKQEDVITALKAKQNWQDESLKWIEEDIKYGKGEIKKFQKAIKTVGQKIKEKEKRIEAMKHSHSSQKKGCVLCTGGSGDGFAVAASQEDSSKEEGHTEGNAKEIQEFAKAGAAS